MTLTKERIEFWREQLAGEHSRFKKEWRDEISALCDMALEGEIHRRERRLLAEAFSNAISEHYPDA